MSLYRKYFAGLVLAGALACAESSTGPGRLHTLPAIAPRFVMPPGTTPASFGLVLDTVRIRISQFDTVFCDCRAEAPPLTPAQFAARIDTTYIDTLVPWPADQESFAFRYEVPEPDPGFGIDLYLEFYSGSSLLFYGDAELDFRRGNISLPPIDLSYIGPGSNADDIQMAPGDTAMAIGDTLQFTATAYNNALPVDTAYLSWRVSDPAVATIDHTGRLTLRSGALGSSFLVLASLPTGVQTSTRVSVPTTVTTLVKVAGDSQSAALGERTAAPLVVRARNAGNQPVAGARVRFRHLTGGGSTFADSIVFTDPLGLARSAPVPTGLGVSTVQAELAANPTINVGLTVTGTAAQSRPFLFTGDSGLSGFQLYRADSTGGGRVLLGFPAAAVPIAGPRWNPARNRVAYTSYNANAGIYQLLLTTKNGDTTAVLVADSNSTGARFSPTGKMIAFVCHALASDAVTGGVCTVNNVDGVLGGLNGAGNGAGRTDLSALVPGRPTGSPAFAWRPDASTRIAFVRDTIVDSIANIYASRIYSVNGDGTTLTPLSPRVADLGHGPLRIQHTIDWSPDGSTIVFTANDTASYEGSLYALDVSTGAIRKLTAPPINWMGDFYPKFSPDGQRILFQRVNYYYCCGMVTDFYVVRLVGGSPSRITYEGANWPGNNPDAYHLGGDWSPNGGAVLVTAQNGLGGRAAYRVPIDVTSQSDYLSRRVLVGTAGIAGLNDYQVSWMP